MSEKFTPGPFFVRDLGPTKDGYHYFIVQAGGPDIGDGFVGDEYFSTSGVMTRETAALISASPDLYAVVAELEESAEYWSEYFVPIGIVDRMRAALKKARGQA